MNNRTIIQRVLSLYAAGIQSDDIRLSHRHAFNTLSSNRSKLITDKIKKNQIVSISTYQELPCISMEKAQPFECPNIDNTNAYILKSTYPLPDLLTDMNSHLITFTSLDGSSVFKLNGFKTRNYSKGAKYTGKLPTLYLMPSMHLYASFSSHQDAVAAIGLFKDPIKPCIFPKFCKPFDSCKSYLDYDFPIDGDSETTLIEMTANELIANFKRSRADVQNNSRDDSSQG